TDFFALLAGPESGSGDSLLYIAQVVAAILGVALTVVAIVVQLAANRYTPKIIDLFVRDKVNVPTLALFVVTVLEGMWVGHVRHGEFNPRIGVLVTLGLSTCSMLVLLPYFRHVFRFLEPANVVHSIRDEIVGEIEAAARYATEEQCARGQARVLNSLDHLFDIARNSIHTSDRSLATEIIFVFRDVVARAFALKGTLAPSWFKIFAGTTTNADFLNFPEPAIHRFEDERSWLERKIFWQFNLLFQAGLTNMRGVCSTIAMVTREMGEDAMRRGEPLESRLCVRALNTYIRTGLRGQDVRTLFNTLQQYRLFAEAAVAAGEHEVVRDVFERFRYYGRTAEQLGIGFILETIAHDLGVLLKAELVKKAPEAQIDALLEVILSLVQDAEGAPLKPATRLGVRRSHCVLATHVLARGREDLARRMAGELRGEPLPRLTAIRDEMLSAEAEFFELTERVSSFGYVPAEERPYAIQFFEWLGVRRPPEVGEATERSARAPQIGAA
ncbi:MAG TPA: DUF2254 family protein, partial [Planctomycetota bacterium]|nr:DUF2254 family protein [Planctomycetota bacterium]